MQHNKNVLRRMLFLGSGSLFTLGMMASPALAAPLNFNADSNIVLGNGVPLVISGAAADSAPSKIDSLTIGNSTLTFSLTSGQILFIKSFGATGGRVLTNDFGMNTTCFNQTDSALKGSSLYINGPVPSGTITPSTTAQDCTVPAATTSSGGGGTTALALPIAPLPVAPAPLVVTPLVTPPTTPPADSKPLSETPIKPVEPPSSSIPASSGEKAEQAAPAETQPPVEVKVITNIEEKKEIIVKIQDEIKSLKDPEKAAEAVGQTRDVEQEKQTKNDLQEAGILKGKVTKTQTVLATNFVTYATPSTSSFSVEERSNALKVAKDNNGGKLPTNEKQIAEAANLLNGVAPDKLLNKTIQNRIDTNEKIICTKKCDKTNEEVQKFDAILKGVAVEVSDEQLAEGKKAFKDYFKKDANLKDFFQNRLVTAFAATDIEKVSPPPPPPAPKKEVKKEEKKVEKKAEKKAPKKEVKKEAPIF